MKGQLKEGYEYATLDRGPEVPNGLLTEITLRHEKGWRVYPAHAIEAADKMIPLIPQGRLDMMMNPHLND